MKRINFSEHVKNVFTEMDTTYDEVKNLMFDLYNGELSEGMTKKEAEEQLRTMARSIFGLEQGASKRDRERAYRDHGREFFDIIEEVVDWTVTTGLKENEWFNALVNYRNLSEGDENLFYQDHEEVILSIAKMGKRHHDTMLQRLPQGKTYSVETDLYGAAVGADIDRFMLGQEDWTKLIDAITKAFTVMIQDLILVEVMNAYKKLPVQTGFVDSGAISAANKTKIDEMLERVSVANDNADVVIFGTYSDLQKFDNLININWIAASQKESVAAMGRLGNYGKYNFVEIPNRFVRNSVSKYVYNQTDDTSKLFFFAVGDDKLVDMVDQGETLINEITERGEANGRIDDIMKYEVQRELGVATRVGRYFGTWNITED